MKINILIIILFVCSDCKALHLDEVFTTVSNIEDRINNSNIIYIRSIYDLKNSTDKYPNGSIIKTTNGFWGSTNEELVYVVDDKYKDHPTAICVSDLYLMPVFSNQIANVKYYGAIGNWKSNVIISKLSLSEAKKMYINNDVYEDDEIDFLAIRKGIENQDAYSIFIPYGGYKVNRTLLIKKTGTIVRGDGIKTQIDATKDFTLFSLNKGLSNVTITSLKLSSIYIKLGMIGTSSTKECINANQCTSCTFENLVIMGFNKGIYCGSNSWITKCQDLVFRFCNVGIEANGEFNASIIDKVEATYCNIGMYLGQGRSIIVTRSLLELNNKGIHLTNKFSGEISSSYFERNSGYDIDIHWGMNPCLDVVIERNSFFGGSTKKEKSFISIRANEESRIVISNNYFSNWYKGEMPQLYGVKFVTEKKNLNVVVNSNHINMITDVISDSHKKFCKIYNYNLCSKGNSMQRPKNLGINDSGYYFYDVTINKPIWWNGVEWMDSAGNKM